MDKASCRAWAKGCLEKAKPFGFLAKSKRTTQNLRTLLAHLESKNILIFVPMGFEPKVLEIMKSDMKKRRYFVPFMQGVSFKMVPFRRPLIEKRFKIFEPPYSTYTLTKIDTVIVPILALDRRNRRIGYGKGMYDRFFEQLGYRPHIIFTQIIPCYCDGRVSDDYDIEGDYLVTSKKTVDLTKGKQHGIRGNCSSFR